MSDDIGKNVSVVLAYLPNLSHTYIKIQNWVYNIYLDL